jgi:hypothetical protein
MALAGAGELIAVGFFWKLTGRFAQLAAKARTIKTITISGCDRRRRMRAIPPSSDRWARHGGRSRRTWRQA